MPQNLKEEKKVQEYALNLLSINVTQSQSTRIFISFTSITFRVSEGGFL